MPPQPTLSVIMTNYNHGRFLTEAIEAILSQSFHPTEIIIIDDASTDDSREIIEGFTLKEPLIRFLRNERNMGVIHNFNYLLSMATGDYIYGAAADDKVMPGLFEKCMEMLARYPQAGLCSTLSRSIDEQGGDKGVFPSPMVSSKPCFLGPGQSLRMLRTYGSWIKGNTAVYKREALFETGGLIPELGSYSDGLIQQVIALRQGVCFIPEPLACCRELPTSFSATTSLDVERTLKILEHARDLFLTRFACLFPIEYIRTLEERWIWASDVSAWYGVRKWQEHYLVQAHLLSATPSLSWQNRLFRAMLRFSIRVQAALVLLYCSTKSLTLSIWIFRRWLRRARS